MTGVTLMGPDGSTPLGFLCCLGLLDVITSQVPSERVPRLSWVWDHAWRPKIHGGGTIEDMVEMVLADKETWDEDTVLGWSYSGGVRDLKPPPDIARGWLRAAARGGRRNADLACALVGDVAKDKSKGNAKPTALHFTAGKQLFLVAARGLRDALSHENVKEALQGPWIGDPQVKSLNWGTDGAREYALRAVDPAGDDKPCIVAAEWLALLGLASLPCFPAGSRLNTTMVQGTHKDSWLTWPLWDAALSVRETRFTLACGAWQSVTGRQARDAIGIQAVYTASIGRSDQGGYGSFAPSQPD